MHHLMHYGMRYAAHRAGGGGRAEAVDVDGERLVVPPVREHAALDRLESRM